MTASVKATAPALPKLRITDPRPHDLTNGDIARSDRWSAGAPGVVVCSGFDSRLRPICVATVPTRPLDTPAASRAATTRNEVVVLPSVPVMPTTGRCLDGWP